MVAGPFAQFRPRLPGCAGLPSNLRICIVCLSTHASRPHADSQLKQTVGINMYSRVCLRGHAFGSYSIQLSHISGGGYCCIRSPASVCCIGKLKTSDIEEMCQRCQRCQMCQRKNLAGLAGLADLSFALPSLTYRALKQKAHDGFYASAGYWQKPHKCSSPYCELYLCCLSVIRNFLRCHDKRPFVREQTADG